MNKTSIQVRCVELFFASKKQAGIPHTLPRPTTKSVGNWTNDTIKASVLWWGMDGDRGKRIGCRKARFHQNMPDSWDLVGVNSARTCTKPSSWANLTYKVRLTAVFCLSKKVRLCHLQRRKPCRMRSDVRPPRAVQILRHTTRPGTKGEFYADSASPDQSRWESWWTKGVEHRKECNI